MSTSIPPTIMDDPLCKCQSDCAACMLYLHENEGVTALGHILHYYLTLSPAAKAKDTPCVVRG